ncbi:MAG: OsmC family protein [Alphaproteobacteria bacterium]|nr:OsmC family protein [Alphaproteobacteria bacterium]
MPSTKITFTGSQNTDLAAALDWPQGEATAFAIFAHCFTCSKDLFASRTLSNALTSHGFAVLRFDFTGLGHSDGEFANTNFSSNAADLVAAASWLAKNHQPPTLLVGHSLGGAAVLAAADRIDTIKAVATIGAPASADHILHLFSQGLDEIREAGEATVQIGGRPFTVKSQFIDDVSGEKLTHRIATLKGAKLVLHSPVDQTVGIENAEAIFRAIKHPKSFVSLDTADHLLSKKADAIYAANVIAAWASRFTNLPKAPLKPEGHVAVAESGEGKYHLNINASGHFLNADEPESVGGTNRGATPYDLLCAALGACTTITLRMYADRKKLPVTFIETLVDHEKQHGADSAGEGNAPAARIDVFTRRIKIVGDLDETQRQRLLQIANLCPVHKTLENSSTIRSELLA